MPRSPWPRWRRGSTPTAKRPPPSRAGGGIVKVTTPTHVNGILEFAGGAVGTITTTFDVWGTTHVPIEIYGSEGTLLGPDPNGFAGGIRVKRAEHAEWFDVPYT